MFCIQIRMFSLPHGSKKGQRLLLDEPSESLTFSGFYSYQHGGGPFIRQTTTQHQTPQQQNSLPVAPNVSQPFSWQHSSSSTSHEQNIPPHQHILPYHHQQQTNYNNPAQGQPYQQLTSSDELSSAYSQITSYTPIIQPQQPHQHLHHQHLLELEEQHQALEVVDAEDEDLFLDDI